MKVNRFSHTRSYLAVMLGLFMPLSSYAFGLGDVEVQSALNQPFKAKIELLALTDDDKELFSVALAPNREFEKAGLERSYVLSQLQFELVTEKGEKPYVLITSSNAVKEPFLNFLVSASAGAGRVMREYTVLLDPPNLSTKAGEKLVPANRVDKPQSQIAVQAEATTAPVSVSQPGATNSQQLSDSSSSATTYGPVSKTDTLWVIAKKTKPSDASIYQMMMAYYEINPDAFLGNVNSLKEGAVLDIPTYEQTRQLSQRDAINAFYKQNETWQASANQDKLSLTSLKSDTTKAEENVDARLKLVAPDAQDNTEDAELDANGNAEIETLSEQLTLAQEAIEAQTQENIDFKARMTAMEEQLETMRRLISLKDADLARMQAMLEDKQSAEQTTALSELEELSSPQVESDPVATEVIEANTEESTSINEELIDQIQTEQEVSSLPETEEMNADESAELEAQAEQVAGISKLDEVETDIESDENDLETLSNDVELSEAPIDIEPTVTTEPTIIDPLDQTDTISEPILEDDSASATNAETQQVLSQSPFDKLKSIVSEYLLYIAGAVITLLLLLLLLFRNRAAKEDKAEAEEDIFAYTPEPQGENSEVVVSENIDDEKQEIVEETPSPVADEDTAESLIERADMFIGYADYEQAQHAIEQARRLEPDSFLVNSKLLFVLFKQQQAEAFLQLVEEGIFNKESEEWTDIKQWGMELLPEHPLFIDDQEPESEVDFSAIEMQETNTQVDVEDEVAESSSLDFEAPSFDLSEHESASTIEEMDDDLNIDQPLSFNTTSDETDDINPATESVIADNDDNSLDFIVEQNDLSASTVDDDIALPIPETDETLDISDADSDLSDDIEFDLENFSTTLPGSNDEIDQDELDVNDDNTELAAFDIDLNPEELDQETSEINIDDSPQEETNSLDLTESVSEDLHLDDEPAISNDIEIPKLDLESDEVPDLDFDLTEFDDIDEIETKLDLASAYIDMDDQDGARSILSEVLESGNDDQKQRAESLIASLN